MASATPEPKAAPPPRQNWSGQWGFIISAVGSAVGLGNIWRFPGVAFNNGGGAFLIPYLVALLTAGIPILFLDYTIGHRFRGSAPLAFRRIARWAESLGWFQVLICVFIALYYAAILAWAGSYFVFSFNQKWGDDPVNFLVGDYLKASEPSLTGAPVWGVFVPMILIWVASVIVLALRLTKGVERANLIFMPLLVVAFGVLVVRAVFLPGASIGLNALFTPDFSKLTDPNVWIAAYSQIFFSLSIAFGIMITFASYRKRKSNQTGPGLVVGFANSAFEILAGIGVFSVLGFMVHQDSTVESIGELKNLTGVGLSFMTFPKVISEMPQAWLFGGLFFGSLLMAGFTSFISILEVISSAVQDKFGLTRARAAIILGIPLGLMSIFTFGTANGLNALDVVDKWTNEVGIITSAIIMMVITMWVKRKGREFAYHLSSLSTFRVGTIWRVFVSLVCPLVLGYIFVSVVVDLIKHPYEGYPSAILLTFGWGSILIMVVGALVFKALRWRHDPDNFDPWPPYPPVADRTAKGVQG